MFEKEVQREKESFVVWDCQTKNFLELADAPGGASSRKVFKQEYTIFSTDFRMLLETVL